MFRPATPSSSLWYRIKTEGKTETHELKWHLPQLLTLLNGATAKELSTELASKHHEYSNRPDLFQLKLIKTNDDILFVYLCAARRIFQCTIKYVYGSSEIRMMRTVPGCITMDVNNWRLLTKIPKQSFFNDQSVTATTPVDHFVHCEFKIFNDLNYHLKDTPSKITNDFEYLLKNQLFTDVTVKAIDGEEFKVHKAMLACRSAVFRANFEHDTKECHTNVVESPFESEVMREVLTFIYSDKSPKALQIPEKILHAADYYQLPKLKQFCEEAIPRKLTVENAVEILELADSYSANILKQVALMFIKLNAKLVVKTDGWAKLKSAPALKSISEFIIDNLE